MQSLHAEEYRDTIRWLVMKRLSAGITQAELSEKIGKPQSFVSKFENFERRLDLVEFIRVAKALDSEPTQMIKNIYEQTNYDK